MRLQSCELAHQQLELNPAAHPASARTLRSRRRSVRLALALILLLLPSFLSPTPAAAEDDSSAAAGAIVVSEIHYEPADKQAHVEFVELYNASSEPIDLSGWAFTEGIRYEFAQGVILAPGRYLVVAADPARLLQRYGVPALGPFTGRLANEGEQLVLRNSQAGEVDNVEYGVGFPWPIGGSDNDLSINLVNAALDNNIPGAWRASGATPGAGNGAWLDNPPPFINAVEHTPASPSAFDSVQIRAQVTDADGVASVRLLLQDVAPGNYIRLTDPAYSSNWIAIPMQEIGPDLYAADLPAPMRVHRHLIRYRIEATDRGGRTVTAPYWEDPQSNFALYVYNGTPAFGGAIQPDGPGDAGAWKFYDFNQMRAMAVYQLLGNPFDVADAQQIPYSPLPGYMGNDYPWLGTLVYNGVVYDHISFRARGGLRRYATGKNNWKFDFLRGHHFQVYDDYAAPYPVKWDKLVFSAVLQHANRRYRGEQGMFETLSYRLFNLAGVPASATHFVHFRVVDQPAEQTSNQYNGDYWGLYLAIENVDGHFLDQHELPDGNLYEMKGATGELDNDGENGPADNSDLIAFMNGYLYGNSGADWWRTNFNLANYYSYRSIIEAIHHYDVWEGKNYYYYLNPTTRQWSVLPWDLDITWAETLSGTGLEPFFGPVLGRAEFQLEYQNRLREIRDLLFTPDQIFPMIDEVAALIDTSSSGLSMVGADRVMWDYNPILISDYVDEERAKVGQFYRIAPSRDFRGVVQLMRDYVMRRTAWIDATLLTDRDQPFTPGIWYNGAPGFPADQLTFDASAFRDPQGDHTFAAIQWRAAELVYPGLPGYNAEQPSRYEIEATWQSSENTSFQSRITLPQGACRPGVICRVRVRVKDQSGRWSNWSAPIQFVAGQPGLPAAQGLVVSELMYHPLHNGATPADQMEFIELRNSGGAPIDLAGAHFTTAIAFTFFQSATLAPGRHLVLAADAQAFAARYGFQPFGEFAQNLKNSGEPITLVDIFGRTLLDFSYSDEGAWDAAADGAGYSLVLRNPATPGNLSSPASWRTSQGIGGSPGADDPEAVLLNEVIFNRSSGRIAQVELHNPGVTAADVSNWILTVTPLATDWRWQTPPTGLRLAAATTIPPGGYLVASVPSGQLPLDGSGSWTLALLSATADNRLTGYGATAQLQPPAAGDAVGRAVTAQGSVHFVPLHTPTPGAANAPPQVGPVVISRMMIHPADGIQWLELTNLTDQPVALYDEQEPARTWMIAGALLRLPTGISLPPHGQLWVAGADPATLCMTGSVPTGVRVTGPFADPLSGSGVHLALLRPLVWGGDWVDALVDVVQSGAQWPLPGDLNPIWQRSPVDGFGPDATNWQVAPAPAPTLTASAAGALCLFEALPDETGASTVRWIVAHDPTVRNYILATSDAGRSIPETATIPVDRTLMPGQRVEYVWQDAAARASDGRFYWLAAEHEDGALQDVSFTNWLTRYYRTSLPLIAR